MCTICITATHLSDNQRGRYQYFHNGRVHGDLRDRALSRGEGITTPGLTKWGSQPAESNKTDARNIKMYHLPLSGRGVAAEPFAEADVAQFTPFTV